MNVETLAKPRKTPSAPAVSSATRAAIEKGLQAWENGRYEDAQQLLGQAVAADLRQPEGWYRLGRIEEEAGDLRSAVYCYFLASDIRRSGPALEALERLGYLGGN